MNPRVESPLPISGFEPALSHEERPRTLLVWANALIPIRNSELHLLVVRESLRAISVSADGRADAEDGRVGTQTRTSLQNRAVVTKVSLSPF